jgi:hypothetical protein
MLDIMKSAAAAAIQSFAENRLLARVRAGEVRRPDYINLLLSIYHQVYQGTMSFALAASGCPPRWTRLREYLIAHTHEEMAHYRWILDDLDALGYDGPAPAELHPAPAAISYVAFNVYNALYFPPSRLCSSTVLEGLSTVINARVFIDLASQSGIGRECFSFFVRHAQTDREHISELWSVLGELDLSEREWSTMVYTTRVAGDLYKAIYDEAPTARFEPVAAAWARPGAP